MGKLISLSLTSIFVLRGSVPIFYIKKLRTSDFVICPRSQK